MYDESAKCLATDRITRVDIKTELTNEAAYLKKAIAEHTERLRIVNEKYRLINKNKDLEAYINLDRMR